MMIISFILMILTNDSAMLLLGEIRCWSLSGFNGLKGYEKKEKNKEKTSKLFIVIYIHVMMFYKSPINKNIHYILAQNIYNM